VAVVVSEVELTTAGGNEEQLDPFIPNEPTPRDPSVRDVLAQLAEMEAAILALRTAEIEAKIDALLARMDADEVARG